MRVFVSHATEDKPRVLAITAALPAHVQSWLDIHQIGLGDSLDDEIRHALEDSHVFLVFASKVALTKPWVANETEWALAHERQTDRVFVLPVLLEAGLDLKARGAPFDALAERLHLQAFDADAAADAAASARLAGYLFHWVSDWIDTIEPEGGGNRRFVAQLEQNLVEFKTRLFELHAILAWPLEVLVTRPDATQLLIQSKDRYNAFTEAFIPRLARTTDEVRERYGPVVTKVYVRLAEFIEHDVYRGAAYALNDVIKSINAYETELRDDAAAFAAAEARREERVAALKPVMAELSRESSEFIGLLK